VSAVVLYYLGANTKQSPVLKCCSKISVWKKKLCVTQGRRQKNFQGGPTEKTRPKNSTIKPPSTLSILCIKSRVGAGPLPLAADAHGVTHRRDRENHRWVT